MLTRIEIGAAIAYGLHSQFKDDAGTTDVGFALFVLFIGVAMAITVSSSAFHLFVPINVYEPNRLSLYLLAS